MDDIETAKCLEELQTLSAMLSFAADRAEGIEAGSLAFAIEQARKIAMLEIESVAKSNTFPLCVKKPVPKFLSVV